MNRLLRLATTTALSLSFVAISSVRSFAQNLTGQGPADVQPVPTEVQFGDTSQDTLTFVDAAQESRQQPAPTLDSLLDTMPNRESNAAAEGAALAASENIDAQPIAVENTSLAYNEPLSPESTLADTSTDMHYSPPPLKAPVTTNFSTNAADLLLASAAPLPDSEQRKDVEESVSGAAALQQGTPQDSPLVIQGSSRPSVQLPSLQDRQCEIDPQTMVHVGRRQDDGTARDIGSPIGPLNLDNARAEETITWQTVPGNRYDRRPFRDSQGIGGGGPDFSINILNTGDGRGGMAPSIESSDIYADDGTNAELCWQFTRGSIYNAPAIRAEQAANLGAVDVDYTVQQIQRASDNNASEVFTLLDDHNIISYADVRARLVDLANDAQNSHLLQEVVTDTTTPDRAINYLQYASGGNLPSVIGEQIDLNAFANILSQADYQYGIQSSNTWRETLLNMPEESSQGADLFASFVKGVEYETITQTSPTGEEYSSTVLTEASIQRVEDAYVALATSAPNDTISVLNGYFDMDALASQLIVDGEFKGLVGLMNNNREAVPAFVENLDRLAGRETATPDYGITIDISYGR